MRKSDGHIHATFQIHILMPDRPERVLAFAWRPMPKMLALAKSQVMQQQVNGPLFNIFFYFFLDLDFFGSLNSRQSAPLSVGVGRLGTVRWEAAAARSACTECAPPHDGRCPSF